MKFIGESSISCSLLLFFGELVANDTTPLYFACETPRDQYSPLEVSLDHKEREFSLLENDFPTLEGSLERNDYRYKPLAGTSTGSNSFWITLLIFYYQTGTAYGLSSNSKAQIPTGACPLDITALVGILSFIVVGLAFLTRLWDVQALIIIPFVIDIGLCYFGNDSRFSTEELLALSLFSLGLNGLLLKNRLDKLERTGALIWLLIPSLGVSSAFAVAYSLPDMKGRYSSLSFMVTIGSLLATLLWSFIWIAFFEKLGIAEKLDRGDYDAPISAFLLRIFDGWIHHLIAELGHTLINRYLGERQLEPAPAPAPELGPQQLPNQYRERFDDFAPGNSYPFTRRGGPYEDA